MLNKVSRRILRLPAVGKPFCAMTHGTGLDSVSRWASRHAGYMPSPVRFEIPGSDGRTRTGQMLSAGGNDQIARNIWLNGLDSYESPLPRLFMRLVRGAKTVLDVGANSGLYAILAALSEPACRVFSFEPFPEALACLRANLALNAVTDRVSVVPAAAGSAIGETELFIPEKGTAQVLETSASLVREFRPKHSAVLKIAVDTLDHHVSANDLGPVSLIRADVEGAEHQVLQGAGEILKSHRPFVLLEILAEVSAGYLEKIRSQVDYRAVCISDDALTLQPIVTRVVDSPNYLWYPPEKHQIVLAIADEMKFRVLEPGQGH